MDLTELILLLLGTIVAALLLAYVIIKISSYYKHRYGFSVWGGMLLLTMAFLLVTYDVYHFGGENVPMLLIAAAALLLTAVQDIRLAGFGMGLLALLFQLAMAVGFLGVAVLFIIRYFVKSLRKGDDYLFGAVTGTSGSVRDGAKYFFRFFLP